MDFSNLYDAAYFGTRLSAARQATGLPASAQFDLARSPLSDSHLEAAAGQFGGTQGNHGFGISALFDHLISSSPQSVAVGDLRTMQQRLVSLGYMPQDVPVDGQWNADWSAAYRRHDRDTVQTMLSGSSPTSTTVQNGLRVLGYVTPASVFQGMVGAAKGIVDQSGHTLVRGGAVGGALEGAAIGAGVGNLIPIPGVGAASGAVVGAIAGGLIGFFGSLFGHHENIGQALSPLDEYADKSSPAYVGSRGIWEDLSTVANGASLLIGGGDVAAGVKGAMTIADAAPEGESALRFALSRQSLEQPPFLSRLLLQGSAKGGARALAARTLGGAAVGGGAALLTGHPEDILPGALIGGGAASVLGPLLGDRVGTMLEFSRTRGLMATMNTPAWTSAREIFTGFSKANVGIRTFGSFGYGKKPFPVLQQIEKAPELPDAVNWALFGLYPDQFFPLKLSDLAAGADRLMGERGSIAYVHLAQSLNPGMSRADALELRNKWLGDTPAIRSKNHTFLLEGFGVDQTAADRVSAEHADIRQQYSAFSHARAGVVRELNAAKAAGDTEKVGSILNRGLAEPYHFASWLLLQAGRNRGLDALPQFLGAAEEAAKLTDRFRTGDLPVELLPEGWTAQSSPAGFERQQVQSKVTLQGRKVSDLKSKLQSARPEERAPIAVQLDQEQKSLDDLKARLARIRPYVGRGLKDVVIAAVRAETPLRSDYERLSGEYADLAKAQRAALKTRSDTQIQLASGKTEQWLDQQVAAGVLPARIAQDAKVAKPGPEISNFLRDMSKGAAKDVNVPDDIKARFDALGYKPALTGPDLIMPTTQGTNLIGLGDYTRRRNFWETMGLGTKPITNRELNAIRQAHIQNEVQSALLRNGITYSARGIIDLLGDHLAKIQDKVPSGFLDKVGKQLVQKTDLRDLSVDDIQAALQRVPGIAHDYQAATDLQSALKRGTAFGGEVSLLHPLDSARALAFANRTAGLPGFADAIRTWHMKDPALWDAAVKGGEPRVSYVPEPALVASRERSRVERELEAALGKTKTPVFGRRLKMMLLDSVAKYAVDSGQAGSYDEFFKGLSAEYKHQFDGSGDAHQLFQKLDPPNIERLAELSRKFDGSQFWYEDSAQVLHDLFGGRYVKLGDGRSIELDDLMTQVIARSSPLHTPLKNWEEAMRAVIAHVKGEEIPKFSTPAGGQITEGVKRILSGETIDRWGEGLQKSNPKLWNFYQNLRGQTQNVTVDSWMFRIFKGALEGIPDEAVAGLDKGAAKKVAASYSTGSLGDYNKVAEIIRQVAAETGQTPMGVQASLWAAVKDFWAEKAIRDGDTRVAAKLRDARSYADLAGDPKIAPHLEELQKLTENQGAALLQRVQDDVRGSIAFGPDYNALIRFYRTADTSTLVHEYLHLLQRWLSPEDNAAFEAHYGVAAKAAGESKYATEGRIVSSGELAQVKSRGEQFLQGLGRETRPLTALENRMDAVAKKSFDAVQPEWGGATINPQTGRLLATNADAYAVTVRPEGVESVRVPVADRTDPAKWRAAMDEAKQRFGEVLARKDHYLGVFHDAETGFVDIDPVVVVRSAKRAEEVGAFTGSAGGAYHFKSGNGLFAPRLAPEAVAFQQGGNWSHPAQEAFAYDLERLMMHRIQPPRKIAGPMGRLVGALGNTWGRMRGYAADRNLVAGPNRDLMDRVFGENLKSIEQPPGRPALSPFAKNVFVGAATGAGLGYLEGRKGKDAEMGAVYGALAGLGIHQIARLTNGYLPDALVRVNSAIRYGLSFSFDARRYTKNNFIAMSKYGLPGMVNPEKYLRAAGDFESLFEKGALVRGDQAVHEAYRYMDQIYGRNWFSQLDGLDQFASARGILGFNPRAFEAAHAYLLRHSHPNWSDAQILDAVSHIEHYGPARTNFERSANFVFFPLSFEKKLLTAVQDSLLQAPFRNLVVYEGLRRYYAAGYDKKMSDFLDRHAPLLQQLGTLNAFSHGLGPGEFFLSGVGDRRSNLGRAAMLAGATFLGGSGLHTTAALGQAADLAVNAFTPLVVTGESIQAVGGIHNAVDILKNYVPFINDLSNVSQAFSDQLAALGPGGETPFSQLGDYYSNLRQFDYQLEPFSQAMGYSSVDGFLRSGMGSMYKPEHDQLKADLAQRYPAAIPMIASFTDKATINQKALLDLASIPHRTPAEDAILQLAQKQNEYGQMVGLGMPSSWVKANELTDIRAQAMRYAGDKQFVELWNQIFMSAYGPITEAVA